MKKYFARVTLTQNSKLYLLILVISIKIICFYYFFLCILAASKLAFQGAVSISLCITIFFSTTHPLTQHSGQINFSSRILL
jgi:hypothetical protein